MPEKQKVKTTSPRGAHDGAARAALASMEEQFVTTDDQVIIHDYNRSVIVRNSAKTADGSLSILIRKNVVNSVGRDVCLLHLQQDIASFEVGSTQSMDSLLDTVSIDTLHGYTS